VTGGLRAGYFLALAALSLLTACSGGDDDSSDESNPFGLEWELVAGIGQADAIEVAPDGRVFYLEHWTGDLRVISADGELQTDPVAHVDTAGVYELGATGLALDPEFETNHYIYILYFEPDADGSNSAGRPKVVRFTEADNHTGEPTTIVDDLPETDANHPFNISGGLHFGPDGYLYLTLGDYDQASAPDSPGRDRPQDLSSAIGKVLRVDKEDGSPAPDNPFVGQSDADPRVYAYGFHQPFDFAFHPESDVLYGSDNQGGVTCEELNAVTIGGNYGWAFGEFPYAECNVPGQITPVHFFGKEDRAPGAFESAVLIRGMDFISAATYPQLGDALVVCESSTGLLRRLVLAPPSFDSVSADDVIADDCYYDVDVAPDGIIYYANLNEIRRLIPPEPSAPASP
jgi:glucose/arabinose dehydrogenase